MELFDHVVILQGIVDRTREHLSGSDAAIIRMRRRLMDVAEALEGKGTIPPGVADPALYHSHGEQALGDGSGGWQDSYGRLMAELLWTAGSIRR